MSAPARNRHALGIGQRVTGLNAVRPIRIHGLVETARLEVDCQLERRHGDDQATAKGHIFNRRQQLEEGRLTSHQSVAELGREYTTRCLDVETAAASLKPDACRLRF
jgi:hypothetical protein